MAWNTERGESLRLIEVRGKLPEQVICPDTGEVFYTNHQGGTVPKRSAFTCKEATCGQDQDLLVSVKQSRKSAPFAAYAIQGYCPQCDQDRALMFGRFFALPFVGSLNAAFRDWEHRKDGELGRYWPSSRIPVGAEIGDHDVNGHRFTHWWTMFNPRQLLVHSQLLKAITTADNVDWSIRELLLGVFQQYLRNQNLFCFWNTQRALEPLFSDNHFHPKSTAIENCVFNGIGRGDFKSSSMKLIEACQWNQSPWEIAAIDENHSQKVQTLDPICLPVNLECCSTTDLKHLVAESFDLVITDPPFGGLLQYAELSDFFYVWLQLALKYRYPQFFSAEYTPKALEAVSNQARQSNNPDVFYQKILTECWREAGRILKPGGILAFTFHHSEDEPWIAVLESLFDAGFYLEAAYPIRSDETKGEGATRNVRAEDRVRHHPRLP